MKWLSFSVIALLSLPVGASQRIGVLHWWCAVGVLHWWRAVGTGHSPSIKAVTV